MWFTIAMLLECHEPGSRRRWWLSLPRTTGMHGRVRRRSLHLSSTIWTAHSRQKAAQHSRHWFHGADPKRVGERVVCLLRSSTLYLLAGPESSCSRRSPNCSGGEERPSRTCLHQRTSLSVLGTHTLHARAPPTASTRTAPLWLSHIHPLLCAPGKQTP